MLAQTFTRDRSRLHR